MCYAICINEKGVRFIKEFTSPYLMDKFVKKCKRSKKITISGTFND